MSLEDSDSVVFTWRATAGVGVVLVVVVVVVVFVGVVVHTNAWLGTKGAVGALPAFAPAMARAIRLQLAEVWSVVR